MTNQPHIALDASMGPTVPELVSVLEPFVRRNEDGSFVAPKDEALSDLITLAVSMQKTLASLPQQTAEPVKREVLKERLAAYIATEWDQEIDPVVGAAWPEREGDDGYRGNGGYIAIQPSDVLHRCREQAERLLNFLDSFAHPASPPVGGAVNGVDPKLVKYVEMLRHECAYKGPCADNGDGCTCDYEELHARHIRALASSERSGREVALIEAAEELLEHMDDYGHIGGVDVLPLRDAVAAIRNLAGTKTNE